jgi:ribonuclease P protein component
MAERFPRSARLRRQKEFDRVYKGGAYAADEVLVIRGLVSGEEATRLGLSVSRKVGGAVVRNRWKRLIREAFRINRSRLPNGLDLVVRPRKGSTAEFAAICESLPRLAGRVAQRLRKHSR